MDRRFLAIAALTLLLASVSLIFTAGYFFFGWGGQYKYELFYFPSPVVYTLDSLTTTGRMLSFVLPVVAFLTLLLTAEVIRIPTPGMLPTGNRYQRDDLAGSPMKQYPTGILAASAGLAADVAAGSPAPHESSVRDLLNRLFPYDHNQSESRFGQIGTNLSAGPEKTTKTTMGNGRSLTLLTKT